MEEETKIIRMSVRGLVEFLLRSGSLERGSGMADEAVMLEGARIHRRLQKEEGPGYRAEAALSLDTVISPVSEEETAQSDKTAENTCILRLEGRADGIFFCEDKCPACGRWTIDEIKTLYGSVRQLKEAEEIHLAQARCYAHMYAEKEGLESVGIRMTYCSQLTGRVKRFYECWTSEELRMWFEKLIEAYLPWIRLRLALERERVRTLKEMTFPFPYREGQYELAAGVYRTIVHGRKLFLQAPTGTGKTMAVLFPALKAISEGKTDRVFFLTARTVGARAAVEALEILRSRGLSIRSLVLTSRDRICPCETVDCSPFSCTRAEGHFDRVNEALRELLLRAADGEPVSAERLLDCAEKHRVCPYELAVDACDFADVIICDYNYVFHPQARLKRFFGEGGAGKAGKAGKAGAGPVLLIDEAHNLLERGRDMYSASICEREVRSFRRSVREKRPDLWKKMKSLVKVLRHLNKESAAISAAGNTQEQENQWMEGTEESRSTGENRKTEGNKRLEGRPAPSSWRTGDESDIIIYSDFLRSDLLAALRETCDMISWILEQERRDAALNAAAGKEKGAEDLTDLLEFYFSVSHFQQILEETDERYIVYSTRNTGHYAKAGFSLYLYCADPSKKLRSYMETTAACIFFSATFLPIQYYKGLLGGTAADYEMYARSSFPVERQQVVIVNDVTSRYRNRSARNYERIARSIGQSVLCRKGNYMAFFPSYAFLEKVLEAFCRIYDVTVSDPLQDCLREEKICVISQKRQMGDDERAAFLDAFEQTRRNCPLLGFCVMGGIYGEGIDLRNDRLIGSIIVGTGIPPVDSRRELLRQFFSEQGMNGYDYAYRFPGMNKVLQAAGRVIRTKEDLGVILLLDSRFEESSNRELFPVEWGTPAAADSARAAGLISAFWRRHTGGH